MLTEFTSYDEIRAALGVAPEEITDLVLALPNYELVLGFDLEELGDFTPTVQAQYETLVPNFLDATPTLTANQLKYVRTVRLYSTYVLARHLLQTMPMFAPRTIKDAKTEIVRTQDPYADTKAGVENFYVLMRARLIALYIILNPSQTAPVATGTINSPMLAVALALDPVTGR